MGSNTAPPGRRARAKEDKRHRITNAARDLFAEHGVAGVTTQQIADRADVAIGTLYLYVATKAELLIMVQNQKFADAIDTGLAAVDAVDPASGAAEQVLALVGPVVDCITEHPENGRIYLHELVFGDALEPHRTAGLALSLRLEEGLTRVLARDPLIDSADAATLARVITAIVHLTTTSTVHLHDSPAHILQLIHRQVTAVLGNKAGTTRPSMREGIWTAPPRPVPPVLAWIHVRDRGSGGPLQRPARTS